MKVWNGLDDLPDDRSPAVASIGNYDGVHRGHQRILESVVGDARQRGAVAALITFDPHPLTVVAPDRRPDLVQTRRQKLRSLESTRIDEVLIVPFDAALAALEPEAFFEEFLLPRYPLGALHVGDNFRFGKARRGDVELLASIGQRAGFDVRRVGAVEVDDRIVSSSAIRHAVRDGDVALAERLLGRPFALTGLVARGESRGRELGFPTANLEPDNMLLPRPGVYLTQVRALAGRHAAMTNIGLRPTFGRDRLTVETHVLDFDDDLYGQRIEVLFLERLRDEQPFDGPAQLADQLARDRAAAESYFARLRLPIK
ncbi:MAG: bifunctional riboflavin kinase/FAD synthetase [Acidobacteria bacterium]|nr:bifunctional riboflavin kinase/FAD synthetase [Acidobacteriota bacterium]NIM62200.1 bifunctional riboflavin kinase/FAD synthetase [Acidobacteriota bacterium]NIO59819.1 bifunctional riboflavin kinase/FAD synthetase [Acidobacteriota bacterium]NIQ30902.1 bifunctional riboflavin kinase/FAD synthetase [Acidobacteriota bacterium]NIQ85978.1 bifunctional riboflavin kinase/FAD synthetase [Acidobacteriota bacterium]